MHERSRICWFAHAKSLVTLKKKLRFLLYLIRPGLRNNKFTYHTALCTNNVRTGVLIDPEVCQARIKLKSKLHVVAMCSLDNTVIWIPINFRHCKRRCTSPVNYGLQPSLCNKSLHDKVTWTTQLAACCIHRKWPPGSYMYYSTNCHDPETAKQLHCTAYYANVFVGLI